MDLSPKPLVDNGTKSVRFAGAVVRAREALAMIDALPQEPSLKQTGMALGSLVFRLRELSARWPSDASTASGDRRLKSAAVSAMSAEADPGFGPLSASADIPSTAADFSRWAALLAESLECSDLHGAKPLLDGLLKGLPRIQEEVTRRIYQQDLNS